MSWYFKCSKYFSLGKQARSLKNALSKRLKATVFDVEEMFQLPFVLFLDSFFFTLQKNFFI